MPQDPLIDTLRQAGFKGNALKTAWAIANRESSGSPTAFNPNQNTGDLSYGLFQINMLGNLGPARRREFGINSNEALFDPLTNAKAAYKLSKGGTDFGPWGVGPNAYRQTAPLNTSGFPGGSGSPVASAMAGQQTAGSPWAGVIGVPDKIIGTPYAGTHTIGNWESDNAVDLAAPVGTPIYAAAPGTIGSQFGSLGSSSSRFAGLRLHLDTPGNEFYYAHLSRFAPNIRPGAQVTRGELLGYSGEANGVGHLHFGSEHGDPRKFIGPGGVPSGSPTGAAGPAMSGGTPPGAAPTGRRQLPAAVQQALSVLRS